MNVVAADLSPLKLKEVRAGSRRLLRPGGGSRSQSVRKGEWRLYLNPGAPASVPACCLRARSPLAGSWTRWMREGENKLSMNSDSIYPCGRISRRKFLFQAGAG